MLPKLGMTVIFRSRTGKYDVPAIVTATMGSLDPDGVKAGHVPPLTTDRHVHLSVLTPGIPGLRAAADDFVTESPHGRSENIGGIYQEWDVPHCGSPAEWAVHQAQLIPPAGTWRPAELPR